MNRLVLSQITLKKERSISSTKWYYLLQPANATAPDSSSYGNPPPTYSETGYSGWSLTEPSYTIGDDRKLYQMSLIVYTDGTYEYSTPTLSSSYEASKAAYNEIIQAEATIQEFEELGLKKGYIWTNETYRAATESIPEYPIGAYIASGINGTITRRNSNTYGLNTWVSTGGIKLRYNAINLAEFDTSNLNFYYPSTSSQQNLAISLGEHNAVNSLVFNDFNGNKGMELTTSALTFYNPSTHNAQLTIGANGALQSGNYSRGTNAKFANDGTKIDLVNGDIITKYFRVSQGLESGLTAGAYIHGTIEALSGSIGTNSTNYWEIGNGTDYNLSETAKMIGHGSSYIQLGDSSTWRLATNRIHTGWYTSSDNLLHYPLIDSKYWDFGIHIPNSDSPSGRGSDKFLYIRSAKTTLTNLLYDIDDNYSTAYWDYKFWIDKDGKVHAPGFYIGNSTTPIGGGAGTVAEKLTQGYGSNTQPIYVASDGTPTAITANVGNSTTPIYMNGGTLTALSYTIAKSVPSNALFTDHITSASTTGNGNAVTSITSDANGNLTVTKGTTFLTSYTETDPTVPSWAKASNKPSYSYDEITGTVPQSALPSYVDDVVEYSSKSSFPTTGESGKIYIDTSDNKTYRWSGTTYVEISSSLALGETDSTAYRGDRGKTAYDHAYAKGSAYTSGLYKITTNNEGHVTGATAVVKKDITDLGIPSENTTYSFSANNPTLSWGAESTIGSAGGVTYKVTMPSNPNTDTKVNVSTRGTTKAYLLGVTSSPTSTKTAREAVAETGVYFDTTAATLVATTFKGNLTGTASGNLTSADLPSELPNPKSLKLQVYNGTSVSTDTTYKGGENSNSIVSVAGTNAVTNISSNNDGKLILTRANGSQSDPITVKITATTSDTAASADKLNISVDVGSTSVPVFFPSNTGLPQAVESIAYNLLPTGTTASTVAIGNHLHGNITNDGKITSTATIASGDKLVIVDSDSTAGSKITGSSITFGTSETTFLSNKGTWISPVGTTYTFDGTYNASTNKAATVSTVTNAINALDVTAITGSASKTITSISETNGKISVTYSDISITKSQISDFPSELTPSAHTHGNIQNNGTLQTNDVTIANNDKLVITDASDSSKIARSNIKFDGSTTTTALTPKGTWETFSKFSGSYNDLTNRPTIPTTAAEVGIKFGYTTSGNNRAVLQDSSGNLYVTQKDDNAYHTTGSWGGTNGLTYTATANGGAGALAFTLPIASTLGYGVTQLTDAYDSDNSTLAVTGKAVASAVANAIGNFLTWNTAEGISAKKIFAQGTSFGTVTAKATYTEKANINYDSTLDAIVFSFA